MRISVSDLVLGVFAPATTIPNAVGGSHADLALAAGLAAAELLVHLAHLVLRRPVRRLGFRPPLLLADLAGCLVAGRQRGGEGARVGQRGTFARGDDREVCRPPVLFGLPSRPLAWRQCVIVEVVFAVVLEPYCGRALVSAMPGPNSQGDVP